MHNANPPLNEEVTALRARLQHAHDGHKQPPLQVLYRLASGRAHSRQEVARLLGVHRNTVSRWLAIYAAGGLAALLATYVPAGKPVSLAPAVLASLERALHRPEGFASYAALRQWVRRTHGVEVKDQDAVHARVYALQGQAQRAAPQSHQKTQRPFRSSKPAVTNASSAPYPPRTRAPGGCLARANVASACSRPGGGASRRAACSLSGACNRSSSGSRSMAPSSRRRGPASSWDSPI
jgi:transposase